MSIPANQGTAPELRPTIDPAELKAREEWFGATPDPWNEITVLAHGEDRTFANTVSRLVVHAEPAQRPALEQKLLQTLARPEHTDAARQFVCRMLGLIGSAASVPALTLLLNDDRTSDDARLALDGISDPAIDAAYAQALVRLHGRAKAGLIGSIAARGNVHAVDALTAIAIDSAETTEVRAAAERAVERLREESSA